MESKEKKQEINEEEDFEDMLNDCSKDLDKKLTINQ